MSCKNKIKVRITKGINIPINYRNYYKGEVIEVFEKDKKFYGTYTKDNLIDDIPKNYVEIIEWNNSCCRPYNS